MGVRNLHAEASTSVLDTWEPIRSDIHVVTRPVSTPYIIAGVNCTMCSLRMLFAFQHLFWISQPYISRTVISCFFPPVKKDCVFKCWNYACNINYDVFFNQTPKKKLFFITVRANVFWLSVIAHSWSLQLAYVDRIQDLSQWIYTTFFFSFIDYVLVY